MPLQGTFDVLDFSALLEILSSRNLTGRLHVRSRSFAANLFFVHGQIVGADQSEHQAAAISGDIASRVQEVCFQLLGTDRGSFEFHIGKTASRPGGTNMEVSEAMEQARKRLAEWHELQEIIPSLDIQPHLVPELDPGQVTLDRAQWHVLTAVDGRRNLRAIGRALNLSDFEVCRAMRELLLARVVELDFRPVGMASMGDTEVPLATEQVTINGKRATRLRTDRAQTKTGMEEAGEVGPTIVISPGKTGKLATRRADAPSGAQATAEDD
jgi:hypothetical protein